MNMDYLNFNEIPLERIVYFTFISQIGFSKNHKLDLLDLVGYRWNDTST